MWYGLLPILYLFSLAVGRRRARTRPTGAPVSPRRARTRPTGTKSAAAASPQFPTAAAASPPFPKGLWEGAEPPPHFPKRCGNYNQGLRPGGRQLFKVSTGAPLGQLRDGANPSGGPSPGSPLGLRDRPPDGWKASQKNHILLMKLLLKRPKCPEGSLSRGPEGPRDRPPDGRKAS